MTATPRLAIVIVHYRYLEDTLALFRSLLGSGQMPFKIFLVNNYPADGSGRILCEHLDSSRASFRYIEAPSNPGFAGGANLGIREALREDMSHVVVMNNDMEVVGDFAKVVAQMVQKYPDDVLAGKVLDAQTGNPTYNLGYFSRWTGRLKYVFEEDYKGRPEFISGGLVVLPSKIFNKIGMFDERYFMYCEDMELCLRLMENNVSLRYCSEIVIHHKVSSAVIKSGFPREYYLFRNESYTLLRKGPLSRRIGYVIILPMAIVYKVLRRPWLSQQVIKGAWDGVLGNLGKIGGESGKREN